MQSTTTIPTERRDRLIRTYRRLLEADTLSDGTHICRSLKDHARACLTVLEADDTEGMKALGIISVLDALPILDGTNYPHAETMIDWLWPHTPDRIRAKAALKTWALLYHFGPEQTEILVGTAFPSHIKALDKAGLLTDDLYFPEVLEVHHDAA